MNDKNVQKIFRLGSLAAAVALASGCGLLGERDSAPAPQYSRSLQVPPDLLPPDVDPSFSLPQASDTRPGAGAALQQPQTQGAGGISVMPVPEGMELRRDGSVRHLHVGLPPEVVWTQVREFFREQRIPLTVDAPELGLLETAWVQNTAGVPPQGAMRQLISRIFGDSFDATTRNQFRVRIEADDGAGSNVFVSHRGVEEISEREDLVRWVMMPADPEAEARMLVQIMNHMGGQSADPAQAVASARMVGPVVRMVTDQGPPYLMVEEPFNTVWRRTGVLLDRASLLVDNHERSAGLFFVTYRPEQQESAGFFRRMFAREDLSIKPNEQFVIQLREFSGQVRISVHDQAGSPVDARKAEAVLMRIQEQLVGQA